MYIISSIYPGRLKVFKMTETNKQTMIEQLISAVHSHIVHNEERMQTKIEFVESVKELVSNHTDFDLALTELKQQFADKLS